MSNKGRRPDEKELSLWEAVKQTVMPIHRHKTREAPPDVNAEGSSARKTTRQARPQLPPIQKQPTSPKSSIRDLDRRTMDRLRKGKIPIDGTLDLHGMTQHQAHHALNGFVTRAFQSQKRCLLVITGKGSRSEGDGVLKTQLPLWVQIAPLDGMVINVQQAAAKDGGSGAYYLYLKRQRQLSL